MGGRPRDADGRRRSWLNIYAFVSSRIENFTPDMSQAEVERSIEKALQVWAKVTPLRFSRVFSGRADIMVSFGRQCEY